MSQSAALSSDETALPSDVARKDSSPIDCAEFLAKASPLQAGAVGVKVVNRLQLHHGAELCISKGDATTFGGGTDWPPGETAVVNAANCGGIGGAGVDGAFNRAGGRVLEADRAALPCLERGIRILEGSAVATGPNRYGTMHVGTVIHAVGPNYMFGGSEAECDGLLKNAYATSMRIARERGIQYVGFSLLSAGIFRGSRPLDEVLKIAVSSVVENAYEGLREVHLIGFMPQEVDVLVRCAAAVLKPSKDQNNASM